MGMIPSNAQPIINARRKGMKPADLVIVSLIGRINEMNHVVYASPKKEYEWFWAREIDICIYAASDVNWSAVARSIASQRPSQLAIWDADRKEGADVSYLPHVDDIDKPQDQWRWNLDFLPWLTFQNREFAWS